MIISHKHKFIFIKTKKTAGTSIEVFLSQFCGNDDIVTPIFPHEKNHIAKNYFGKSNIFSDLFLTRGKNYKSIFSNFIKNQRFYNHMPAILVKSRIGNEIWNSYYKFCVERDLGQNLYHTTTC